MIISSKDILNLVAAISIATLVFFLCWALYYIISTVRSSFKVVKKVEKGVDKVESLIDLIKEKISSSTSHLILFSNLIKKGIDFFEKRKFNSSVEESNPPVEENKDKKKEKKD